MNYSYNRRPPRRKITGRFFAFLSALLVLVVMVCVLFSMRGRQPQQQAYQPPTFDPDAVVVQTTPSPAQPASEGQTTGGQIVAADPNAQPRAAEFAAAQPDDPVPDSALAEDGSGDQSAAANVGEGIELGTLPQYDEAVISELSARTDLPQDWTNILLLGSDSRDMSKISRTRCDTIMIVSVNGRTGQLKMLSVMRDTMIDIPGKGMRKINEATEVGGPALMMKLLNENLGLNITTYAIVNFAGMANIIDILDGVLIDVTKDEAKEINKHMGEIAEHTMEQDYYLAHREEWKLKTYGNKLRLNGIQAVTYARIRYIDSDYQRTQRQRNVINAIMARVKGANIIELGRIANEVFSHLKTNVSIPNGIGYAMAVLNCSLEKDRIMEWRIPGPETSKSEKRDQGEGFYDVDYPELARRTYKFIYQTS